MNVAMAGRVSELLIDPKVTPNSDGLPGMDAARKIVGALLTFGLIGAVAGVAVSASLMRHANISKSENFQADM